MKKRIAFSFLAAILLLFTTNLKAQSKPTAAPPAPRVENSGAAKKGFVWVRGEWKWWGGQYEWVPGHWERERAGFAWYDGAWKKQGDTWVYIPGEWRVRGQVADTSKNSGRRTH